MLWAIVRFELRYQLRQPLLWGAAALFAMLAFVATATDAVAIGGAIGSLNRNAPYVVIRLLGSLSLIGSFGVVAFIATAALRDVDHGTADLIHARPVRPRDLLLGRFAGALTATCGCFAAAAFGLIAGSLMPWIDAARLGPFAVRPYLFGLAMIAFPTFAVLGAICFALATRVRHIAAVYAAFVGLLVAYFVAAAFVGDLDRQPLAAHLDPFGLAAFELDARYWTIAERNARVPSFGGALLWNRLGWLAAAAGVLAWAIASHVPERAGRRRRRRQPADVAAATSVVTPRYAALAAPAPTAAATWAQLWHRARLETRLVLRSLPFLLILAFGLINVLANMGQLDAMLGTPVWPVTYLMLLAVRAGYSFLLVLILGYYAGEAVWRERSLAIDGIVDAIPVPTWVLIGAKLLALWAAAAVFLVAGIVGLAGFQLSTGYTRLEPWLYAQGLLVELVPFLLTAVLAMTLQAIVNQKFAGYLLFVLYLVGLGALGALHFDHYLYRFATLPPAPYSDLNGWGPFAAPLFWFSLYWTLAAGLLLCLARAAWVRGGDARWRMRWRLARQRFRGPTGWAAAGCLAATAATGAFIFWNTNVRNAYVPSDEAQRRQAEYERRYRPHRDRPQPRVAGVRTEVAIHPRERRADIRGTYRLVNRTDAPIADLHVGIAPRLRVHRIDLPPHQVVADDRRLGYAIYRLATPIAPGQEIAFGFHLEIDNPGFVNSGPDHAVAGNGSFIHTGSFPSIGYQDGRELDDPAARRALGLPPLIRQASIDDAGARRINSLARDADWMTFEATVSTEPDQIAIAPGILRREWMEGGRRVFHYRADAPIPKFFAIQSGRYAVRRDRWQDVAIEVFHHPTHTYNVDRMVAATKATLAYLSTHVGPYQHRHLRIVEFPRYARLAGSFPGTIPFSESLGFIARLRDPSAIDYPFMVTAHEVGHQWWGHQVLGADVQGSAMLSESLAQYTALMVMREAYGAAAMRRVLRYELDRYLRGRGGELLEERPLALVERQPYIHYAKGGLAFYALQDAIGEARLNAALRRYVAAVRFQAPPYTVSRELLAFIAEETPAAQRPLLDDLFERIALFDNRATEATARRLPDGRYEVTLRAAVRKLRADGTGVETDVTPGDAIDVGVFGVDTGSGPGRGPKVLYMQKHQVTGRDVTITTTVAERPIRAGIDPWHVLIDRTPADNVREVELR